MKLKGSAVAILALVVSTASPGVAQDGPVDGPGWAIRVGGGIAAHGSCGECRADPVGGAATVTVWRTGASGWALGGSWNGAWLDGDFGRLDRYAVQFETERAWRRPFSPFVRFSIGPTLATVVGVSGPPEPPGFGDVVVDVGNTMGFGLGVGAGGRWPFSRRLSFVPEVRVLAERTGGAAILLGTFTLGLEVR